MLQRRGRDICFAVAITEYQREGDTQDQSIGCESQPDAMPVFHSIGGEVIYDPAADKGAHIRTDAVGHQHEEPLCASPDFDLCLAFYEKRPRDIKEVEGHPVDDHGKEQQGQAAARIADAEQSKPEYPGEDTDEYDPFDPEFA